MKPALLFIGGFIAFVGGLIAWAYIFVWIMKNW